MKINTFIYCSTLASLIVLSGGASAVPDKNSPGANGVPFQRLQDQIDGLQEQIDSLQEQIGDINTQIAELSAQVEDNADLIGMLEDDLAALEDLVAKLEAFRDKVALGCPPGHSIRSVLPDGSAIHCEKIMDSGLSIQTATKVVQPRRTAFVRTQCPAGSYLIGSRVVEITGAPPTLQRDAPLTSGAGANETGWEYAVLGHNYSGSWVTLSIMCKEF